MKPVVVRNVAIGEGIPKICVQLLAGGWSKITKDYKITGIPRFMVFDKKGNIVSVDAPRPSSPELKKMLENEESRLKQIT